MRENAVTNITIQVAMLPDAPHHPIRGHARTSHCHFAVGIRTAISLFRREIKYGMRVIVDQQRSLAVINRPADLHAGRFVFV